MDTVTFYDDITLELLDDEITGISDQPELSEDEINSFKVKPFPHQIEAINYGLKNPQYLLLDSMGLGKTCEIIWTAETLKRRGLIDHCLIICGVNSLKQNWKKEISKFSTEDAVILGAYETRTGSVRYHSVKERAEQLKNKIDEFFIITNIESLRDDKMIEAFNKSTNNIGMIAFDECHKCVRADTLIETNKGTFTIKDIVDNNIDCLVKSYSTLEDKEEYKPIINYWENLKHRPMLKLTFKTDEDKVITLDCTDDHKIYTANRGFIAAKDLTENDEIVLSKLA